MESMEISIADFIQKLWNDFSDFREKFYGGQTPYVPTPLYSQKELIDYGRRQGWLENQDELYANSFIDKRTAARIIHQFMKTEMHISDLEDIRDAEILKDLYTCRICVNHVAQIYLRGIMEKEEVYVNNQQAWIFNMTRLITKDEANQILKILFTDKKNYQPQ